MKFSFLLFLTSIINCFCFDEKLVYNSVVLSQNTYCNLDTINCYDYPYCDGSILDFEYENGGSKVIGGYLPQDNQIFISYRGSENIQNWINNVEFRKINPYENSSISVERGFYNELQYTKDSVLDNLSDLIIKYNTVNLLITGHSAGAALSTLLTYDLFTEIDINNILNISLITFGSPRVGNLMFVDSFNYYSSLHQIYNIRVTHYRDIVPHLPQEMLGYLHIPTELWFNEDNSVYKTCDDTHNNEDNTCSDSCAPLHCTSTDDHMYYLNMTLGSANC